MAFYGTALALDLSMTTLDTLWYTRSRHPSPLGLAAQLGWLLDEFRDTGPRLFTVQDSVSPSLRATHLDHHLPYCIRQGGNVPALWARARGARTRVIGLSWLDEFQGVLVRPDSELFGPGDLARRRLALPVYASPIDSRRAEALHGYLVTLAQAGLQADDVRFVDVHADLSGLAPSLVGHVVSPYGEYSRQIAALLRRDVDAVYVKGARGLQAARAAQAKVLMDLRSLPDPNARIHTGTPRPITADETLLQEYPELVVRFLCRVVAVGPWACAHPRETRAYLARETRTETSVVHDAYGHDVHLHLSTDLDQRSVRALETHRQFLLRWGFLPNTFDIHDWIDPQPLNAALSRLKTTPIPV